MDDLFETAGQDKPSGERKGTSPGMLSMKDHGLTFFAPPGGTIEGPGDELFSFTGGIAGAPGVTASFDGGAGDDTLDAYFYSETAAQGTTTDFTQNPDGSFTATYRTSAGDPSIIDSVTVTNVENIRIVLGNNFGSDPDFINPVPDFIQTGDGDDFISTAGDADTIIAGKGIDTVDGGSGTNSQDGTDIISKDFSDVLVDISWDIQTNTFSGPGSFTNLETFGVLQTGGGDDTVVTSTIASTGPGGETISTGTGDDAVSVFNGPDIVDLGSGTDRLIIDWSNSNFTGNTTMTLTGSLAAGYSGNLDGTQSTSPSVDFSGVEHFTILTLSSGGNGGNLADEITTGDGNDSVFSGSSSDLINVGRGEDTVDGGETGSDIDGLAKEFGTSAPGIFFDLLANTFSGPGSYTNLEYFIDLKTGNGDDVITTSDEFGSNGLGDDLIDTRGGDDIATFYFSNDEAHLGDGNDTLVADYSDVGNLGGNSWTMIGLTQAADGSYSGNFDDAGTRHSLVFSGVEHFRLTGFISQDMIETGDGDDYLDGQAGNDTLISGAGNDTVIGGAGSDSLDGEAGIDTLDYSNSTAAVNINLSANTASGGDAQGDVIANFEAALGGGGSDTLTGTSSSNFIDGGNQDDMLVGAGGNDTLIGSAGRDTLDGGTGADFLSGRVRDDSLMGGGGTDTLAGNNGADTLEGGSGGDLVFGGPVGDNIFGDGGSDILRGNAGDDTIEGGTGDDDILGSADSDVILGNAGDDTMGGNGDDDEAFGGTGEDLVRGNAGNDIVRGEAGNDQLLGGNGDDTVIGGVGEDRLAGGTGADRFVFAEGDTGSNIANADLITDFDQSESDRIRLNAIDAITGGGDDAFDFIGTSAFSGTAGELRYEQTGGNTHIFADTDGDGTADFALQLLGTVDLVAGDFVL